MRWKESSTHFVSNPRKHRGSTLLVLKVKLNSKSGCKPYVWQSQLDSKPPVGRKLVWFSRKRFWKLKLDQNESLKRNSNSKKHWPENATHGMPMCQSHSVPHNDFFCKPIILIIDIGKENNKFPSLKDQHFPLGSKSTL